jgi:hypothetical protein
MTPQVLKAINHVKVFYPKICLVVFNTQGLWQYMDENFESSTFGDEVDVSILEEAVDSLDTLPAVFEIY